jgi:hypothetical protein
VKIVIALAVASAALGIMVVAPLVDAEARKVQGLERRYSEVVSLSRDASAIRAAYSPLERAVSVPGDEWIRSLEVAAKETGVLIDAVESAGSDAAERAIEVRFRSDFTAFGAFCHRVSLEPLVRVVDAGARRLEDDVLDCRLVLARGKP